MNDLAQRLRTAREHAGLSQGQVAKLLNLHRPTITEIEAGRRKVNTDEVNAFAEIYDVSVPWLMGAEKSEGIDDRVRLAARGLSKLKSEDLDKVLELLSSMRSSEEQRK